MGSFPLTPFPQGREDLLTNPSQREGAVIERYSYRIPRLLRHCLFPLFLEEGARGSYIKNTPLSLHRERVGVRVELFAIFHFSTGERIRIDS